MATIDEILDGLLASADGAFSPELAAYFVRLRFSDERAARYQQLADANQGGTLTAGEREELDAFVTANTLCLILKSKARRQIIGQPSAA